MAKIDDKTRKKTRLEAHRAIILIGVMILVGYVFQVSALEFDNVKSVEDSIVTITNSFGLGDDLTKVEMIDNTRYCLTECHTTWNVTIYDDTNNFLTNLKFKDITNLDKSIGYKFEYIESYKEEQETIWSETVIGQDRKVLGTRTNYIPVWKTIDPTAKLSKGTYIIRLTGYKDFRESVDWIPSFYGVEIKEWDWWYGSAPLAYWMMNETAGNANDTSGNAFNLTNNNGVLYAHGKLGNMSYNFNSTVYFNSSEANLWDIGRRSFTIAFWINRSFDVVDNHELVISNKKDDTAAGQISLGFYTSADASKQGSLYINLRNKTAGGGTFEDVMWSNNISDGSWHRVVFTRDNSTGTSNLKLYVDNVLRDTGNDTYINVLNGTGEFVVGTSNLLTINKINITVDDVVITNTVWSATDVNTDWNGGAGQEGYVPPDYAGATLTYNLTTYETASESFVANVSLASAPTNPRLYYDGTAYTATATQYGSYYLLSKTLSIQSGVGSKIFWFNWSLGGINNRTSNYTQTVAESSFALCNASLTTRYLNISFRDEVSGLPINASAATSTFYYWIGSDASVNKSLSFSDATENLNYSFCFTPNTYPIKLDSTFKYASSGYPQRTSSNYSLLNNTVTNKLLYLLSASDGIYVTFQVINNAEQVIEGVAVTAEVQISGVWTTVGEGTTGADGGITFWLNPDLSTRFTFVKDGYDTYQVTITPTQTSYTINLGGAGVVTASDYQAGITYASYPANYYLSNNTNYVFNFTIVSTYWTLDNFGFNITNATGQLIGATAGGAGTGGSVILTRNTGLNESFIMTYYWTIEGNRSIGTRSWIIINTEGTDWSIKTIFDDITTYLTSGLFGLTRNGLAIIVFLVIFVFTGVMTMKFGISSPAAIMAIIFGLVAFFDVGLNLIPNPTGTAIPHIATIFVGIILFGLLIKEVTR